ncbi:MAG: hypothetical protein Q4A66_01405 [Eubacteriales bacterium]|nr:hypothetical protein [Eubacteriales bacterium]
MKKQEAYIRSLRRQNALLWVLLALTLVFMVVVGETALTDSRTRDNVMKGMTSVFFLWQGVIVWRIVRNRRLLKNPGMLLWQQIRDGDERRKEILGRAGGRFALVFCALLSVAALTALFYDKVIFYTLYITLLCAVAIFGALLLYYRRKLG